MNHRDGRKNAAEEEHDLGNEGAADEDYEDEDEDEDEDEADLAAQEEDDSGEEGSAKGPLWTSTTQHYHHHSQQLPPTLPPSAILSSTESPLPPLPSSSNPAYPSLPPPSSYSISSSTQSPLPFESDDMEIVFRHEPSSSSTASPCPSEDEFLCHSTGTCLPLARRCDRTLCQDNFADCSSPETMLFDVRTGKK